MLTLLALHGSGRDETDLLEFCHQLTSQARVIAPRGPFAQSGGFTFFRRRLDRSIDAAEVIGLAKDWVLQEDVTHLPTTDEIVLVGYSSGAIFAEALLTVASDRFSGAILMRPEPLSRNFDLSNVPEKPILIIAGKHDERRRHDDAAVLAEQFIRAGAVVSLHVIDAGHGWSHDNADVTLARSWLASVATI